MIYCVLLCDYCNISVICKVSVLKKSTCLLQQFNLPPSASEFELAHLKLIEIVQQKRFRQAFAKLKDEDKFEDPANFLQETDLRRNK